MADRKAYSANQITRDWLKQQILDLYDAARNGENPSLAIQMKCLETIGRMLDEEAPAASFVRAVDNDLEAIRRSVFEIDGTGEG